MVEVVPSLGHKEENTDSSTSKPRICVAKKPKGGSYWNNNQQSWKHWGVTTVTNSEEVASLKALRIMPGHSKCLCKSDQDLRPTRSLPPTKDPRRFRCSGRSIGTQKVQKTEAICARESRSSRLASTPNSQIPANRSRRSCGFAADRKFQRHSLHFTKDHVALSSPRNLWNIYPSKAPRNALLNSCLNSSNWSWILSPIVRCATPDWVTCTLLLVGSTSLLGPTPGESINRLHRLLIVHRPVSGIWGAARRHQAWMEAFLSRSLPSADSILCDLYKLAFGKIHPCICLYNLYTSIGYQHSVNYKLERGSAKPLGESTKPRPPQTAMINEDTWCAYKCIIVKHGET